MSSAEDLEKETDATQDYRKYKFLDLNRPLLMQVWFWLIQQRLLPRTSPSTATLSWRETAHHSSATSWNRCQRHPGGSSHPSGVRPSATVHTSLGFNYHPLALIGYWIFGLCFWTIVEYGMHRGLFHVDHYLPDNRVFITLHFLLHGIHHYLPMDRLRLVMPPTLFVVLAIPFWYFAHTVIFWNWHAALAAYCGGVFGYICYDMTHYFLHHKKYVIQPVS